MFSFSSSSFSVTMERIEKCAAAYIKDKRGAAVYGNGEPILSLFDTVMNELSKSRPDFEAIRSELQYFAKSLVVCQYPECKHLLGNSWYSQPEAEYSKVCLQLLKHPDLPFSDAELALPFMIIDFWCMAADRFSNGEFLALSETEINFSDAVEFICSLNMPAELRLLLADKENRADFLIGGDEALKVWQVKMAQPCQFCIYCMSELQTMHSLLNHIFGKVSDADLPVPYTPAVLEPPYMLDKLFNNLVLGNCHFHDNYDSGLYFYSEESQLQDDFISFLRQLSEIRQDDPRKVLKIHDALKTFDYDNDVYRDRRTGEYTNQRDEMEQDYPWCRAYFLWYDAVEAGEDQNNCVLPEALKGDWETELSEFYDYLWEEWNEIAPQAEDGTIHSPEKIRDFFVEERQAFLEFLLKNGKSYKGDYEHLLPQEYIRKRKDGWIIQTLGKMNIFISLFEDGVPDPSARIEVIGDYLDEHSQEIEKVVDMPWRGNTTPTKVADVSWYWWNAASMWERNVTKIYIVPLIVRLKAEMERIASDKSIAVYLRERLLEKMVQLTEKISFWRFSGEEAQKILQKFRKKHKLPKDGSSFSLSFRKIMKMNAVENCSRRAELAETAAAERRKVLFEMSHSIKNLMASVSEPLSMLQDELLGPQRRTVEHALAGAGLIRDLAVGVHMSMRGEPGTWRKDIKEPGFGAAVLDKIILDALRHAVSNMFDGKYFAQFVKNYFGRDLDTFMQAQNEWKSAETAEETFACINKYFFEFKIDCHDTDLKVAVGDRDGTATKLLILFQELFLNAVKYSSFTEREKRFVKLDIEIMPNEWNVSLSNSAAGRRNAKSSGIGLAVIKNFAALFEAKYSVSLKKDIYTTNMKFFLNK